MERFSRPVLLVGALAAMLGCSAAGGAADAGPPGCPPPAPWGYEVGDHLANLAFTDCDGHGVDLHSLCGQVSLVASFYGWCASCPHYVQLVDALVQEHGDAGLAALVVVVEDAAGEPATAAYCAEIRDYYGLTVTTVSDPTHLFESYGTTDLVMLSDRGGRLLFKRQGPDDNALRAAVAAALAQ